MTHKEAINLIKSGKFFSAEFIKKDGSVRRIHARTGVHKYLTGRGRTWNPEDKGYITVWDAKKEQYRMLNTKRLLMVNGKDVL